MVGDASRLSRLLADAHGYAVRATDGESLGRLIWLIYELDHLWPAGLRVQPLGHGESTFSGSWEIPVAKVVAVRPAHREVTVVSDGSTPATRTGARPSSQRAGPPARDGLAPPLPVV